MAISIPTEVIEATSATMPAPAQIPGTHAYIVPKIPAELIGHTELVFKGPTTEPVLYLLNQGPRQDRIVRKTILFSPRQSQEILEDQTLIQVAPLPDESSEMPKYKPMIDSVRRQQMVAGP